ncbi:MAG: TIR domain-containing protein [Candidatus Delongbacteria bacterium]|nr:TIR domain-containing protein [Candidatus Delongbacteria bacterium]MBN2836985.1 TIR domain-containing protein [Candidatus Delongbacteria bacterium]
MAYRNKTYVAFDADNDIRYYRLMQAWKQSDYSSFDFYDAHDLNNIRTWSSEETIKNKLQERLRNTKVFVLLVGSQTRFHYKFVRWEIEQALKRNLPIVVINLNGSRSIDNENCPPILRNELALHVSFNSKIIEKALTAWETLHYNYQRQGKTGDFYYEPSVYQSLGL